MTVRDSALIRPSRRQGKSELWWFGEENCSALRIRGGAAYRYPGVGALRDGTRHRVN